uniref:Uncharacterized protein n=1 Tax=viral metagenome TaxID=1070528 RepID=A0A6M3J447_9ZZZZ
MKVELKIEIGWNEVKVTIEGYEPMVEKLREATKKAVLEYGSTARVK